MPEEDVVVQFRNLVQFFALGAQEQRQFVPDYRKYANFELGETQLRTNRPLKVLTYNLWDYADYPARHGGEDGYEGIEPGICEEIRSLARLTIDFLNHREERNLKEWSTANLDAAHWRLMRRVARIVLDEQKWARQSPQLTWQELCESGWV